MSVLISNDAELDTLLDAQEVEHICEVVLAAEGVEREVEISLSYVDEAEMHELNLEWRGIDRTTDVLSFECDSAFDEDIPADETLELGDIIFAPQVIARQAPGFGNSPADECRLMLVHGMLHLLGYDHIEDEEAEVIVVGSGAAGINARTLSCAIWRSSAARTPNSFTSAPSPIMPTTRSRL